MFRDKSNACSERFKLLLILTNLEIMSELLTQLGCSCPLKLNAFNSNSTKNEVDMLSCKLKGVESN